MSGQEKRASSCPTTLAVSAAEDGMKLLRFLEQRLAPSPGSSLLHKWIRTGQVRVNKGRAKPFAVLRAGDAVRLPPFACVRNIAEPPAQPRDFGNAPNGADFRDLPDAEPPFLGVDAPLLAATRDLLVISKPAGLAVQPGTGRKDSLSGRLKAACAGSSFVPAPAHRLDRDTSGLVLAGKTHAAQRALHRLFRQGRIVKDYLAWVRGKWPYDGPRLLLDRLEKRTEISGWESMAALPGGQTLPVESPQEAFHSPVVREAAHESGFSLCAVLPVRITSEEAFPETPPQTVLDALPDASAFRGGATLLLIRLFTGRKHQIRVQLASRGFPIIGDTRYGGSKQARLLLHAFAVRLPDPVTAGDEVCVQEQEFQQAPDWPPSFLPDVAAASAARRSLDSLLGRGIGIGLKDIRS